MKYTELKGLDEAALKSKIIECRKELMGLRFQKAAQQLQAPHRFKACKKMIARAKTALTQRSKIA